MSDSVREPIQVYLNADERAALERAASKLGVSRSEVLRRGVEAMADRTKKGGELAALIDAGVVVPATDPSGRPPPALPVAPLRELLDELTADRESR